jgi:hypothetical protein
MAGAAVPAPEVAQPTETEVVAVRQPIGFKESRTACGTRVGGLSMRLLALLVRLAGSQTAFDQIPTSPASEILRFETR